MPQSKLKAWVHTVKAEAPVCCSGISPLFSGCCANVTTLQVGFQKDSFYDTSPLLLLLQFDISSFISISHK